MVEFAKNSGESGVRVRSPVGAQATTTTLLVSGIPTLSQPLALTATVAPAPDYAKVTFYNGSSLLGRSLDARHVLSGSADGSLKLWDTSIGTCLDSAESGGDAIESTKWSSAPRSRAIPMEASEPWIPLRFVNDCH